MLRLLLVLVLAAPAAALAEDSAADPRVCSVSVRAYDKQGRLRPARRVDGTFAPAVVFSGRVSPPDEEGRPLLFDVYNPRGVRYQVLLATPRVVAKEENGRRFERTTRTREASMAVAGSSIAWTSMYGRWRVEPRIEGMSKPCGRAEFFTIRP